MNNDCLVAPSSVFLDVRVSSEDQGRTGSDIDIDACSASSIKRFRHVQAGCESTKLRTNRTASSSTYPPRDGPHGRRAGFDFCGVTPSTPPQPRRDRASESLTKRHGHCLDVCTLRTTAASWLEALKGRAIIVKHTKLLPAKLGFSLLFPSGTSSASATLCVWRACVARTCVPALPQAERGSKLWLRSVALVRSVACPFGDRIGKRHVEHGVSRTPDVLDVLQPRHVSLSRSRCPPAKRRDSL